jgi:DNA-binding PadR family transcriptional regulator
MSRESIGEFEQLVLLAILRLGSDAYGLPILEEITVQTGRKVLRPAVYVALRRLEQKGLVTSRQGEAAAERGGRPRKYFEVTPDGLERLRDARQALVRMWEGLHVVLDR